MDFFIYKFYVIIWNIWFFRKLILQIFFQNFNIEKNKVGYFNMEKNFFKIGVDFCLGIWYNIDSGWGRDWWVRRVSASAHQNKTRDGGIKDGCHGVHLQKTEKGWKRQRELGKGYFPNKKTDPFSFRRHCGLYQRKKQNRVLQTQQRRVYQRQNLQYIHPWQWDGWYISVSKPDNRTRPGSQKSGSILFTIFS